MKVKPGEGPIFKEEQAKKAEAATEAAIKREIFLEDLKRTFGTEHGARTLEWILHDLCYHNQTVHETSAKIYGISAAQNVGQAIVEAISMADINIYFKFLMVRRADFIARKINKE